MMLILRFVSETIRDDIDLVLLDLFPTVEYEKHNIQLEHFKITEIHINNINRLTSKQLNAFRYDSSFIEFEYYA